MFKFGSVVGFVVVAGGKTKCRQHANGNGKNDAADYIIVRRIILRMIMPDDIESLAADLNGNGRIDAADYILLRRRIMRQE